MISKRVSVLALCIAMSLGCNNGFANQLFNDVESKNVNDSYFEDSLGSNLFEENEEDILVGSVDGKRVSAKKDTRQTLRVTKIQRKVSVGNPDKQNMTLKKENIGKKAGLKAIPVDRTKKTVLGTTISKSKQSSLKKIKKSRKVNQKVELPEDLIILGFDENKEADKVKLKAVPVGKVQSKDRKTVKKAVGGNVVRQESLVAKEPVGGYGNPEVFTEEYLNGPGSKIKDTKVMNSEMSFVAEERDKLLKEREELVALLKEQQDFIDEQAEFYEKNIKDTKESPLVVQYERVGSKTSAKTVREVPMPDPLVNDNAVVRDYKDEVSAVMGNGYSYNSTENMSKITNEPTLREQSEYQLLDYVNGMMNTIYTKVGYTTVVILPAGEKLQRVTIGDRQRFNVSTVFDKSSGAWHIYLQPVQMDITTNMVIATDRHLFNATLGTSDFFKPFAKWINVPGAVESVAVQDGALDLAVKDIDQLNFKYRRSGNTDASWAPLNVFDDKNNHTFISFDGKALTKYRPVVLTRGITGEVKLVPYSRYKNTFIIDNVYDNLEVMVDNKSVVYTRKN